MSTALFLNSTLRKSSQKKLSCNNAWRKARSIKHSASIRTLIIRIMSSPPLKVSQPRRACLHRLQLSPSTGKKAPHLKSPPANQISSSLHQMNLRKKPLFKTKLNLNTELPKMTCWRLIASLSAVTVLTDMNTHPQVWEWFQVMHWNARPSLPAWSVWPLNLSSSGFGSVNCRIFIDKWCT